MSGGAAMQGPRYFMDLVAACRQGMRAYLSGDIGGDLEEPGIYKSICARPEAVLWGSTGSARPEAVLFMVQSNRVPFGAFTPAALDEVEDLSLQLAETIVFVNLPESEYDMFPPVNGDDISRFLKYMDTFYATLAKRRQADFFVDRRVKQDIQDWTTKYKEYHGIK